MNVLISTNDYAYRGAELTIYSFMQHHKNVNWYICTLSIEMDDKDNCVIHNHVGLSEGNFKKLLKIIKYFDSNSNAKLIDVTKLFKENLLGSPNDFSNFTPYAAVRLMTDLIIPEHVKDLLYLDIDTLTIDNIDFDYQLYTSQNAPYSAYVLPGAREDEGEMISAVMFFNMDICRRKNFFATARRNYKAHLYTYPDQMAITAVCDPIKIDESLNYMRDLADAPGNLKIIHFSSELKPKIYYTTPAKFYRTFPQFKYLKDGIDLMDDINFYC